MLSAQEIEADIKDSLINADPYVGGEVGVARREALEVMEAIGLIDPRWWQLTEKGARCARREQRRYWGS